MTPRRNPPTLLSAAILAAFIGLALIFGTRAEPPARPVTIIATSATIDGGHIPARTLLWVDDGGLSAFRGAYDNRDERRMAQIMATFETLTTTAETAVTVTNRRSDMTQVEIGDGPLTGRRGWIERSQLKP